MGRGGDSTKLIIITAIIAIIACFLPWWMLISEAVPSSGDRTYSLFFSNPFQGNYLLQTLFFTANSSFLDILAINGSFIDTSITANNLLLMPVIISLVGGFVGIFSIGKKKIALVAGLLVIIGALLYVLFINFGILPAGVNITGFQDANLNPIFGTYDRSSVGTNFNHFFGISIGCIMALIAGIIMVIASFKGKD
ncbi:MAG: hypothetical protein ACTSVY_10530 [Candidatus Helarchaeota archaeon]